MLKKEKNPSLTLKLTESAIMLALATVLSYLKLIDLPYGGSITLCSMLPMIIVSYRRGVFWGFAAGLANGVIQLMFGIKNLSYATSAGAAVAIILLDYIFAFSVTGLAGIFKKRGENQQKELVLGTFLVCLLRYVFHVISGCTVWAGLSIPDSQALIYSLAYNATYMLPEMLITLAGAYYLANAVELRGATITRIRTGKTGGVGTTFNLIGKLLLMITFVSDVVLIAPKLQDPNSGEFNILAIADVNFKAVAIITVCGIAAFVVLRVVSKKCKK